MTDKNRKISKEEAEEIYKSLSQEQKDKIDKLGMLMTQAEFRKKLEQNPKEAFKSEGFEVPDSWNEDKNELHEFNLKCIKELEQIELTDKELEGVTGGKDNLESITHKLLFSTTIPGILSLFVTPAICSIANKNSYIYHLKKLWSAKDPK